MGYSQVGKAQDFDSCISLVRVQLSQPLRGQRLLEHFQKGVALCYAFKQQKREHLFLRQEIDALTFYNRELLFVMLLNFRNTPLQHQPVT